MAFDVDEVGETDLGFKIWFLKKEGSLGSLKSACTLG